MRERVEDVFRYLVLITRRLPVSSAGMAAAVYVSSVVAVCALVLHAADRIALALANDVALSQSASQSIDGAAATLAAGTTARSKVLSDEWTQRITSESFWRSRKLPGGGIVLAAGGLARRSTRLRLVLRSR
jgi:Na+/phosphate symporter